MNRKTELPSTNEPIPIPEPRATVKEASLDDYEMTMKEAPGGVIPSGIEPRRQTAVAGPGPALRTMVEQPGPTAIAGPASPYRCLNRPPMGVLIALDDGNSDSGEEWRIRGSRFLIGRTSGDAIIPHDPDMSGEHAEINCHEKDGGYEWQLRDLKSTNGTFLRVNRVILRNGKELLLGGRRYVFRHPGVVGNMAAAPVNPGGTGARVTQAYGGLPADVSQQLTARLIELTPEGEGRQFLLGEETSWIGSDSASCRHVVTNDPFIDLQHAHFFRDKRGRWVVEDSNSFNGVWVRVDRIPLDSASEFQLGGQRFRFRIP